MSDVIASKKLIELLQELRPMIAHAYDREYEEILRERIDESIAQLGSAHEPPAVPSRAAEIADELSKIRMTDPDAIASETAVKLNALMQAAETELRCAVAPQPPSAFQDRVHEWMISCFDLQTVANKVERNHRFLEESLELVQSLGCTSDEAHMLVDYVFSRAIGESTQETGGVMVTLAALGNANNIRTAEAGDKELARCWTKIEQIRAKQAGKPRHSPLPGPTPHTPNAEWISVGERLPPRYTHVWCLNRDGYQFEGCICYGMHKPFFTYPRGDGSASNTAPDWIDVTHWRALPKPPTERVRS